MHTANESWYLYTLYTACFSMYANQLINVVIFRL